jgi:antitoxin VapB
MQKVYATVKKKPPCSLKTCSIFPQWPNQAVRIPRDFEMDGNEAIIRKEGNRLILELVGIKNSLLELLKILEPIQEEFPEMKESYGYLFY